jgi:heptosyltransferase-2
MHIAAAFGVPVVAVFGPTDWRTTAPYGQEQSVVREPVDCAPCLLRECPIDHRCMTRVSVEQVYETALKQLDRQGARGKGQGVDGKPLASGLSPRAPLAGFTVFLDRDGTINPDPGYIRSPDQFELLPGVPQALARLKQAGARLIVVTNQSGIARGLLSVEDLNLVHEKMRRLLDAAGVSLDAIYVCPHHPDDQCDCRKPKTGMIDQAVRERQVDLSRSYFIGDHVQDMQLAKRIGSKGLLVTTGAEEAQARSELAVGGVVADTITESLSDAVEWILADAASRIQPSAISVQHEQKFLGEKLAADS